MNKTVNINLAGIFFHIDENAYLKLQHYLDTIKQSFKNSQGSDEIIADIEARIAELFSERKQHDKQVISIIEVEEVITIMGQPEDYIVDEDIFEDTPNTKQHKSTIKKLYRDTENSYVSGVSSGLANYFGMDAFWIRLIWVILFLSAGTGVLLYIILWVLIPEAKTTAEKLTMKGEPVTVSNIEKKIKDGIDSVSETVKNVDFSKSGEKIKEGFETVTDSISESVKSINTKKSKAKIKSSSTSFFDTIGNIVMFFLKLISKFVGLILMFIGTVGIIGVGSAILLSNTDNIHLPGIDITDLLTNSPFPNFILLLLVFFAIAIPFLSLFLIGLHILITNLKSIGVYAKLALFGVWMVSVIGLTYLGIKQGLNFKEEGRFVTTKPLPNITKNDTLYLKMKGNDLFSSDFYRDYDIYETINEANEKIIISHGINLLVKHTQDSVAKFQIKKRARAINFETGKNRAKQILYNYNLTNNTLSLNNYFLLPEHQPKRGQKLTLTLFLPEGVILHTDRTIKNYKAQYNENLIYNMPVEAYLKIYAEKVECISCPIKKVSKNKTNSAALKKEKTKIKIDPKKTKPNLNPSKQSKTESVNVNIDDNGIKISRKN